MPLRVLAPPGADLVFAVVCDHCGERIADAAEAFGESFTGEAAETPAGAPLWFVHRPCADAFEAAHGGGRGQRIGWHHLRQVFAWLLADCGLALDDLRADGARRPRP